LSYNLRPTTRECVHLITHGHFRSRDEHGGHTIRSVISENPMIHANLMALCFIEPKLLPIEVLHCENRNFRPFALLWPWPWSDDLHIQTWPVFPRDIQDVQIWIHVNYGFPKLPSDRETDTEIIYHAASRVVNIATNAKARIQLAMFTHEIKEIFKVKYYFFKFSSTVHYLLTILLFPIFSQRSSIF